MVTPERRAWIAESDYRDGLALAQLSPGPLAAQLAIYLGFVHNRVLGATAAGASRCSRSRSSRVNGVVALRI